MKPLDNILEAIGNTPLVRLSRLAPSLPVRLYGKVESLNPGGSIKDRIAVKMLERAEKEGLIRPGGTIVEATAGNTGVGLAMVAAVRGYRCIFVLPDKMSREKIDLLKAYGAEVVLTSAAVPPDSPENYNNLARRLAAEHNAFLVSQFTNSANPEAHYNSTGPEILASLGKVDAFVAGVGTGGTISGTGRYLKENCPGIKIVLADPEGSILSGGQPRPYTVEGIGEDFFPETYDPDVVSSFVRVSDAESYRWARKLARSEGILAGGSAGTALAAAIRYARNLPRDATVVAILPDTGSNYLSKAFNNNWLREHDFLIDDEE